MFPTLSIWERPSAPRKVDDVLLTWQQSERLDRLPTFVCLLICRPVRQHRPGPVDVSPGRQLGWARKNHPQHDHRIRVLSTRLLMRSKVPKSENRGQLPDLKIDTVCKVAASVSAAARN